MKAHLVPQWLPSSSGTCGLSAVEKQPAQRQSQGFAAYDPADDKRH